MQEALFWEQVGEGKVRCRLCPHDCLIAEGRSGVCRVRKNFEGRLYTLVYGELAAIHSDPVEKKPLYHFYPGREILSIGTYGCNLRCSFCQNHNISQADPETAWAASEISTSGLVAKATHIPGNLGMAFTYNEPTVYYEFMWNTAAGIKAAGLSNVVVSNGYISRKPLEKLLEVADAFNIDLKSFNEDFYRKMTGGSLNPVLETLETIAKAGKHLEITLLVIPGLNDSDEEFDRMTGWIADKLGPDVPLHLSRYFPAYMLSLPPTPIRILNRFYASASEKLHYVFTGNVSDGDHSSTFCPDCRTELIHRNRYDITITGLTGEGKCSRCGTGIPVRM